MIKRSDDIAYGCDSKKLTQMSEILGQENLALVYYGHPHGTNEIDRPFNEDNDLMTYLREQIKKGSEIVLHGYDHKDITTLSTKEAVWELIRAKKAIQDLLEVNIRYYVPPYHKITQELTGYLKVIGLEVLTDKNAEDLVQVLKSNNKIRLDTEMVYYHWWEMDIDKLKGYYEN